MFNVILSRCYTGDFTSFSLKKKTQKNEKLHKRKTVLWSKKQEESMNNDQQCIMQKTHH